MNYLNILKVAYNALRRNKMRSALTMLGIVIGVGSIIAMTGVGSGAQQEIENQTTAFGTNVITIRSGGLTAGGMRLKSAQELQSTDGEALVKGCDLITAQTPVISVVASIVSSDRNWTSRVYGVNTSFTTIRSWGIQSGSMFTDQDYRSGNKICVLGKTVATNLFGTTDPTGGTVRIQNVPFRVAGILEPKGQLASGQDQDDMIMMPYTTFMKRMEGDKTMDNLFVSVRTSEEMPEAIKQIREIMRSLHRIPNYGDDDFSIRTQDQVNELAKGISKIVSTLMIIVASISLVVGGIGIMNIMLVSVTERTREIGIRMAIGATERDILFQFLVEAVVLSLMGGVIGLILGVFTGFLVQTFTSWAVSISVTSVFVSMSFAGGVGIFFGFYPARKAASLNPIEALRFE
jgi:putative ABC transport system permease protein